MTTKPHHTSSLAKHSPFVGMLLRWFLWVMVLGMLLPAGLEALARFVDRGIETLPIPLMVASPAIPCGYTVKSHSKQRYALLSREVRLVTEAEGLRGSGEERSPRSVSTQVLLLGDDDVFGSTLKEEDTLAGQWEERVPWRRVQVDNAGVPGYRVQDMIARGEALLAEGSPQWVVLVVRDDDRSVSALPAVPVNGLVFPAALRESLPGSWLIHQRLLAHSNAYNLLLRAFPSIVRAWNASAKMDQGLPRHELMVESLSGFQQWLSVHFRTSPPQLLVVVLPDTASLRDPLRQHSLSDRDLCTALSQKGIQSLRAGPWLRRAFQQGPLVDSLDRLTPLALQQLADLLDETVPHEATSHAVKRQGQDISPRTKEVAR